MKINVQHDISVKSLNNFINKIVKTIDGHLKFDTAHSKVQILTTSKLKNDEKSIFLRRICDDCINIFRR